MTKPVTAASALLLREAGKLNINDKLSKYCPKFSKLKIGELDENKNIINLHTPDRELTLLDLLTHTAGFGTDEIGTMAVSYTNLDVYKRQHQIFVKRLLIYNYITLFKKNQHIICEISSQPEKTLIRKHK